MKNFKVALSLLYTIFFVSSVQPMDNRKMDKDLHILCTQDKMDEVIEILRSKPEEIDKQDFMGRSFLIWATLQKSSKCACFLIKHCPELLFLKDFTERVPMHYAATSQNIDICRSLLLTPYKTIKNEMLTMLLINKYCVVAKLPRRVLMECVFKPLREELRVGHKERIKKMLSSEDKWGHKPFESASGKNDLEVYLLLNPNNIDKLYKEVELLY